MSMALGYYVLIAAVFVAGGVGVHSQYCIANYLFH
jgi:hypothetical protein